jgi:uncharacterized protein (DUF305 family)
MKKQIILISIIAFMAGFVANSILTLIFSSQEEMHQMSNKKMMHDTHMDMRGMMYDMNMSLHGKTGDQLDQAFLTEMIIHHEGAVEMAEFLLEGTKRPELIKLANDIISTQTIEIKQMREWNNEWFAQSI